MPEEINETISRDCFLIDSSQFAGDNSTRTSWLWKMRLVYIQIHVIQSYFWSWFFEYHKTYVGLGVKIVTDILSPAHVYKILIWFNISIIKIQNLEKPLWKKQTNDFNR